MKASMAAITKNKLVSILSRIKFKIEYFLLYKGKSGNPGNFYIIMENVYIIHTFEKMTG
jgi:hypothetical protein